VGAECATAVEVSGIIALGTAAESGGAHWCLVFSFISLCASAGVIFETFSGSDAGGRFSESDTERSLDCVFFSRCFVSLNASSVAR
jgi:hypothetical protein